MPERTTPGWRARLTAAAQYLGLAPLCWWRPPAGNYVQHHLRQALALLFILLNIALLFVLIVLFLSYALVYWRGLYEGYRLEPRLFGLARKLFLCWLVFWVFGLGLALLGSSNGMPLIDWLAARTQLLRVTAAAACGLAALATLLTPFVLYSSLVFARGGEHSQAYFLYEDLGKVPRWVFTFAFLPAARAAEDRWGPGAAVALPVTAENIAEAKENAAFAFIGSHGRERGLLIEGRYLAPTDVADMPAGARLEYVYLAGCDSGAQLRQWRQAFDPAQVIAFDRLTAVLEHFWWLWFQAPDQIRALPAG